MINPLVLGRGKSLFKDVKERHPLKLVQAKPLKSGKVSLIYSTQSYRLDIKKLKSLDKEQVSGSLEDSIDRLLRLFVVLAIKELQSCTE